MEFADAAKCVYALHIRGFEMEEVLLEMTLNVSDDAVSIENAIDPFFRSLDLADVLTDEYRHQCMRLQYVPGLHLQACSMDVCNSTTTNTKVSISTLFVRIRSWQG